MITRSKSTAPYSSIGKFKSNPIQKGNRKIRKDGPSLKQTTKSNKETHYRNHLLLSQRSDQICYYHLLSEHSNLGSANIACGTCKEKRGKCGDEVRLWKEKRLRRDCILIATVELKRRSNRALNLEYSGATAKKHLPMKTKRKHGQMCKSRAMQPVPGNKKP